MGPSKDKEQLALRYFVVANTEIGKIEGLGEELLGEESDEMDIMPNILQRDISEQLAYAWCYGLDHMLHIQHIPGALEEEIQEFLEKNIMKWLELCLRTRRYISIYPFFDQIEVSHGNTC